MRPVVPLVGGASPNEIRAWRNSLQYMSNVLGESGVPDQSGVAIEFKIPLTSRRVDVMVSGYTPDAQEIIAVIELKQWNGHDTERVDHKDGIVKTALGGGIRETTHPSYQAWSYANLIKDFNVAVQTDDIELYR